MYSNIRMLFKDSLIRSFSLAIVLAIAGLFSGQQAKADHGGSAGNECIRDAADFNQGNICTANDVRFGAFEVEGDDIFCSPGEQVEVTIRATIQSGPERYDIGLYVDETGGNAQDRGNTCYRDYLHRHASSTIRSRSDQWDRAIL